MDGVLYSKLIEYMIREAGNLWYDATHDYCKCYLYCVHRVKYQKWEMNKKMWSIKTKKRFIVGLFIFIYLLNAVLSEKLRLAGNTYRNAQNKYFYWP